MLAEKVIDAGGVVYGAAFNERWEVEHRRVDTVEGLQALRGSKYVFSKVGTAYADAIADLASGRKVLFSGTPCQVAAMAKRAGKDENLLLIEVVCHGAPEPIYWEKYLNEFLKKNKKTRREISSINFRDKRNGWKNYNFTIKFDDKSEWTESHGQNVYMRGFLKNLTLRESCFKCPFKYPNGSKADISLGDFWGIEKVDIVSDSDIFDGMSLVISRLLNEEKIVSGICQKHYDPKEVYLLNPTLVHTAQRPANFELFKHKATQANDLSRLIERYSRDSLSIRMKVAIAKILNGVKIKG